MEENKHKGERHNQGKLRFDLVHPYAHEQMVRVLTKGAEKYAPRNWEKGMTWSNVIASLKRHLQAIEFGEDYDAETGELHAAHLACNAHFLTAYYKIYPQGDDRPHNYLHLPKIGLDIDEVICNWTQAWLVKHGFPTRPVYSVGFEMSKIEIAKKSGIDIFIDDRFENFTELNNAGICCFLMDAPHNQKYDVGYKRIKDLKDLV